LATNWSTSSEEDAHSENYGYSDHEEEYNFKRKRDEDEEDVAKRRKFFKRDNDDDSNNRPGPSIGGFGSTDSSNESSGNNRVIYDLMSMFLLFLSSIAESFNFFLSNLL
jgi:hypothetical protein